MKSVGRRFSIAGLAFAVTVLAEILVFIVVGHLIGYGWAVLALLALSVVGIFALRREGTRAWRRFRDVSAAGERPGPHLVRAIVGLGAAILLVIPGFVTGLIGLALFVPPVRALAAVGAMGLATRRVSSSSAADLFGPRRVRVKVGTPTRDTPSTPQDSSIPIEGEIV